MKTPALVALLMALLPGPDAERALQVQSLEAPSPASGRYPALAVDAAGTVRMLWTTREEEESVLCVAAWEEGAWSAPEEVARGADWFVNWADFPQLCAAADGTWMATWLKRSGAGSYDYAVQYALRRPAAESWSAPRRLHSHKGGGEHGFVNLLPEGKGFRAVWLDGRNTAAAQVEGEEAATAGRHGHGHGGGAMALYTAHFTAEGTRQEERALDERVCDCCATALTALPEGGWGVAYRDRSAAEVRDLGWIGGGAEATPSRVHADGWKIEGCPVNGPAAARSGAEVAVAWFTLGDDGRARCRFALREAEGGFGAPQDFDLGAPIGRTALCAWPGGGFLLAWMEEGKQPARWMARTWHPQRGLGEPVRIAEAPGGRAGGFLRLAPLADGALAAWTDARAGVLRCARLHEAAATGAER